MTRHEESRLSMMHVWYDYQAPYSAITSSLPNYSTNEAIFEDCLRDILSFSELQKTSIKGITDGKNLKKEDLIVKCADNFRKLRAYAKFTNDSTLAQEVNISESKLRQAADTAVRDYAQIAYKCAQPLIGSLSSYGITEASQTALVNAITEYNASIGKPGASRTESTITTQQLKDLFKSADTALANMDAAVEIIKLTEVNFYKGYQNARRVMKVGRGPLSLKTKVVNAQTGEPEANVTITFTPVNGQLKSAASNNGKKNIVKKTAKGGSAHEKNMPDGTYLYTAKKTGYKDVNGTVDIVNGEKTVLEIQMEKA
jgi:hypothetical protein